MHKDRRLCPRCASKTLACRADAGVRVRCCTECQYRYKTVEVTTRELEKWKSLLEMLHRVKDAMQIWEDEEIPKECGQETPEP
jgi:Zn ribbon nucleic-acid-binding protein